MATTVLIYYDFRMLGHNPHGWDPDRPEWTDAVKAMIELQYPNANLDTYSHPERPGRLTAIVDRLLNGPIDGLRWMLPISSCWMDNPAGWPRTRPPYRRAA